MGLEKRISYLGIADFDYLSARLLLLSGLANTGLPKMMEAFEKLMKLLLMLDAKISGTQVPTEKDLRKYNHDLVALSKVISDKIPSAFNESWEPFFHTLQGSYDRRYPENWKEHTIQVSLNDFDKAYTYMRNNIIENFPIEEKTRARDFGTFLMDAYGSHTKEWIKTHDGLQPMDILKLHNEHFDDLEINKK